MQDRHRPRRRVHRGDRSVAPLSMPMSDRVSVQVCDGCCCGTRRKHPEVDHEAQRAELEAAARQGGGRCRIVGCLDACERSNVVVVRGGDGIRRWFGSINDRHSREALCRWVAAGAVSPVPAALAANLFSRRATPAPTAAPIPVQTPAAITRSRPPGADHHEELDHG